MSCEHDCACREAVLTAYGNLAELGWSDRRALLTCVKLYRCHHVNTPEHVAIEQVKGWVDSAVLRGGR